MSNTATSDSTKQLTLKTSDGTPITCGATYNEGDTLVVELTGKASNTQLVFDWVGGSFNDGVGECSNSRSTNL